jgi:hypothetical protein
MAGVSSRQTRPGPRARTIPANGKARTASMVQVEPRRPFHPSKNPGPDEGCEGIVGEWNRSGKQIILRWRPKVAVAVPSHTSLVSSHNSPSGFGAFQHSRR